MNHVNKVGDIHLRRTHREASLPEKFKVHGMKKGLILSVLQTRESLLIDLRATDPENQVALSKSK